MFCESTFKILKFSRTAEKKKPTMRGDNTTISGSISDRSNFMSDCKQLQVRLKNGKRRVAKIVLKTKDSNAAEKNLNWLLLSMRRDMHTIKNA